MGNREEKEKEALTRELIKELNKDNKEGKIAWCLATDKDNPTDVKDFISTGSTLLDYLICNKRGGGIPVGKITEIIGEEATGKSLLVTQILAETQRRGGLAVYIDEENALNPEFAIRVGLNLDKLVYMQCGCVEKVGETIEKVINLARLKDVKNFITIVWDSVAATPPAAELEGDYDPNSRVGLQAKAIAKMMRKLTQTVGRERVTLVFCNQMKTKIGVTFGDPMGTPGGKAIPYHASVRIRVHRNGELDRNEKTEDEKRHVKNVYGILTKAKVVKNRMGPPLRQCTFPLHFSDGINDVESVRDYLTDDLKLLERKMGRYNFPCKLFQISSEVTDGKTGELSYDSKKPEPAPELSKKEKDDGKEPQHKLKPDEIEDRWKRDPLFKESIMQILDKNMIVSLDSSALPPDAELDPESYTDNEAVEMIVAEGASAA
ncbi:MAG: P-loop NTPase family protein [Acidiferrobacterales bacterium]